jgi:ABC-type uncharacterized transport system permease subunit
VTAAFAFVGFIIASLLSSGTPVYFTVALLFIAMACFYWFLSKTRFGRL